MAKPITSPDLDVSLYFGHHKMQNAVPTKSDNQNQMNRSGILRERCLCAYRMDSENTTREVGMAGIKQ